MQKILVLTDFSNNAYNALFYTTQLLKSKICTFYILNTYDQHTPLRSKRPPKVTDKALLKQRNDESKEGLNNTQHRIVLDNANTNHTFKTISKNGNLVETVSKTVENKHIDLVVMGNKGVTWAKAIFWGSSTIKIISNIKLCPILTIPKEIDFKVPKEIAFVTDYKRHYNSKILAPLLFMGSLCSASLRILHINEEKVLDTFQESNLHTLRQYLAPIENSVHGMPNFASKTKALHLFLEEHSFLKELIREPVIKKVSFDLDIPFLVIPCPN